MVPAPGGLDSVRTVLGVWAEQADREHLELMVLCPDAPEQRSAHPELRLVDSTGLLLHQARAAGIHAARADHVMIAEDHCLPDPGWAERILATLDEGWDVVASSLRPAGPPVAAAQASFLLGYGQWRLPLERARPRALPGHNLVVRRGHLLALEPELEQLLLAGAFLARRLQGLSRVLLEPAASMGHVDPPGLVRQVRMFGAVGASFGAVRTEAWPVIGRAAYALAVLPIAAAHLRRAARHYRRFGTSAGFSGKTLAAAAILSMAWGCGEALGAVLGSRRVAPRAWRSEIKPVTDSALTWDRSSLPATRDRTHHPT
jgi:hypothetical protein